MARTDQALAHAFNLLDIRSAVLEQRQIKIDHTKGDEYSYELCLQYAFSLDFAGLQKTIGEWKPQNNIWQIKRLALQTLLETAEIKNMGKKLQASDFPCDQEFVYAMDILHQIDDDLWQNPEIEEKIKEVASSSLEVVRLFDKTDYFQKKLRPGITKVRPYGDSLYTISADGHNPDFEPSIQLMQTFLELGLPMCSHRMSSYNHEDWYQAFRHIYEHYPFPCLYFSLQYSDHAFLKRVAQDYVYSNKLQNEIPRLLNNMLKAAQTKETPSEMRDAIYKVAPVFMRRVSQGKWLAAFKEIYKQLDLNTVEVSNHRRDKLDEFILDGVSIVNNNTFKHAVMTDCFRVKKINHYHNSLLINAKKDLKGGLSQVDRKRLTDLIATVNDEAEYYVLFNFSDHFSAEQRKSFTSKLLNLPYREYHSMMAEAACEQAKYDEKLSLQLKQFVLKSSKLWETGIAKDRARVSSNRDCLNMNKILEDIPFTPGEMGQIYEKLKNALTAVENVITKPSCETLADWRELLLEMKCFLVKNQTILIRHDDYENTLERVKQAHLRQCHHHKLTELLSSNIGNDLYTGIQALFYDVKIYGIENYQLEYSVLAHIIIQHNHRKLEMCMDHFTHYITKYQDQLNQAQFKPLLKLILEAYRPYFGNDALKWNLPMDKMIAEKSMIDLSALYTRWGEKSDFWETYNPVYSPA